MTTPNFANRGTGSENWPTCWACSVRAPKQSHNGMHGWHSRLIRKHGSGDVREVFCGKCFAEHGWPELREWRLVKRGA